MFDYDCGSICVPRLPSQPHTGLIQNSVFPYFLLQALQLFRGAVEEGHFKQQRMDAPGAARVEVNLHAMTAGVAMLSLYCWLLGLKQRVVARGGAAGLPARLAIVTDKGKSSKEQGNLVVKEAVAGMMSHWHAPFRWVLCPICFSLLCIPEFHRR